MRKLSKWLVGVLSLTLIATVLASEGIIRKVGLDNVTVTALDIYSEEGEFKNTLAIGTGLQCVWLKKAFEDLKALPRYTPAYSPWVWDVKIMPDWIGWSRGISVFVSDPACGVMRYSIIPSVPSPHLSLLRPTQKNVIALAVEIDPERRRGWGAIYLIFAAIPDEGIKFYPRWGSEPSWRSLGIPKYHGQPVKVTSIVVDPNEQVDMEYAYDIYVGSDKGVYHALVGLKNPGLENTQWRRIGLGEKIVAMRLIQGGSQKDQILLVATPREVFVKIGLDSENWIKLLDIVGVLGYSGARGVSITSLDLSFNPFINMPNAYDIYVGCRRELEDVKNGLFLSTGASLAGSNVYTIWQVTDKNELPPITAVKIIPFTTEVLAPRRVYLGTTDGLYEWRPEAHFAIVEFDVILKRPPSEDPTLPVPYFECKAKVWHPYHHLFNFKWEAFLNGRGEDVGGFEKPEVQASHLQLIQTTWVPPVNNSGEEKRYLIKGTAVCAPNADSEGRWVTVRWTPIDDVTNQREVNYLSFTNPVISVLPFSATKISKLKIYNILGQLVSEPKLVPNGNSLQIKLPSGVYFYELWQDKKFLGRQRWVVVK